MLASADSAALDLVPLLWAWAGAAALQGLLWLVARARRNANWVDVGWAASLLGIAVGYALAGSGAAPQRWLAGLLGGVWAGRLTIHLLVDRGFGHPEDGRYRALREHWGAKADLQFAWFFQAQALLAALLSVPFLLIASHQGDRLEPIQWAAVALFVAAKSGETLADRQLARWRREPSHRGRTCRAGLWRYSRHPNYFCEWLIWCSFALAATPTAHGAWAWLAPAAIYVFVTRLTGIPYTEQQALRSRGDDYRRYQRTTNAFFPWRPRADRPDDAARVAVDEGTN